MRLIIVLILSVLSLFSVAQVEEPIVHQTEISLAEDSIFNSFSDSTMTKKSQDSSKNGIRISPNALSEVVLYQCKDSIRFLIDHKKAILYTDGKTFYGDMELNADYTEISFDNNELFASGIADSVGLVTGNPVFKQGASQYRAQEIKFNFTTQKGKITNVITSEGEGYIHGKQVKKVSDSVSYIAHGQYTTCDLDHPHFQIKFTKAKVIQNSKIIMGPAYLSFGDIPTFLALPFGYFPLEKTRASGILMPTFGQSSVRGFFFENFGYYFGISDNFDLALQGDITTRGNWAAKVKSNYVFRYKCQGSLFLGFSQNFMGERHTPEFSVVNGYKIYWDHKQDAKSHPVHRFSAHVDIVSSAYNKHNLTSASDYLKSQYTSSVNFSTNAKGIFFYDMVLSYSQNTQTNRIDFALPTMNMSVNQFYPFRKKNRVGPLKWYHNISMKWNSQFSNQLGASDSTFFEPETWRNLQLGMKHNIPITIPIKIAKLINWNTNINFTEKWYLQATERTFEIDTFGNPFVQEHFKRGFYAIHDLGLTSALTTKIYVLWSYKKGALKAIRHVISPNLNFTYRPNLSGKTYGQYFNAITGQEVQYSYFANSIYGGATAARQQAIANLSIGNNIEIKVRSRKDTITGTKKIALFDNLTFSTGYDFAADSLNWQYFNISGRTSLLNFLDITFQLSFDPYILDELGNRVNQTEWKVNKRFWRLSNSNLTIGVNWRLNRDFFKGKQKGEEKPSTIAEQSQSAITENALGMPNIKTDFENPWNLVINYSFSYMANDNRFYYMGYPDNRKYDHQFVHTLNLSGDLNITKKWKVGFTTGYDFVNKSFSYTSLDFYRDLHCWEMRFNWIPFGYRKGWSFTLNVKASVLSDLKIPLKRDYRDNYY